jgi:hypothetical protein
MADDFLSRLDAEYFEREAPEDVALHARLANRPQVAEGRCSYGGSNKAVSVERDSVWKEQLFGTAAAVRAMPAPTGPRRAAERRSANARIPSTSSCPSAESSASWRCQADGHGFGHIERELTASQEKALNYS